MLLCEWGGGLPTKVFCFRFTHMSQMSLVAGSPSLRKCKSALPCSPMPGVNHNTK